jgi:hypothetical protein
VRKKISDLVLHEYEKVKNKRDNKWYKELTDIKNICKNIWF